MQQSHDRSSGWIDLRRRRYIDVERQTIEDVARWHQPAPTREPRSTSAPPSPQLTVITVAIVALAAATTFLAWTHARTPAAPAPDAVLVEAGHQSASPHDEPRGEGACALSVQAGTAAPARADVTSTAGSHPASPKRNRSSRASGTAAKRGEISSLDEASRTAAVLRDQLAAAGR